jgi:hypothetical protein
MIPAEPGLRPAAIALDVRPQRVASFKCLFHGIDPPGRTGAALQPCLAVVPDLSALYFNADDPGAFDGDNEVNLMVLLVVGHTLADHNEIIRAELLV